MSCCYFITTDMCIFALKEVIEFYNSRSSPLYMCFMDASKAFDKINHFYLSNNNNNNNNLFLIKCYIIINALSAVHRF